MPPIPRWFHVAAFVVIGGLLALGAAAAIFPCEAVCAYDEAKLQLACNKRGAPQCFFVEFFKLINSYNGLLSAISSVVIAAFTFSLMRSTARQWQASRRQAQIAQRALSHQTLSSQRQLRAYLGLVSISVDMPGLDDENYQPHHEVPIGTIYTDFLTPTIKNFGPTPAFDVSVALSWVGTQYLTKIPNDFQFYLIPDAPTEHGIVSRETLLPTQQISRAVFVPDVTGFKRAKENQASMYVYGEIRYTDIYNNRWGNYYCFVWEPWRSAEHHFTAYDRFNGERKIN